MEAIRRVWAIAVIAWKRLGAQRGLTLATLVGLSMAIGLMMVVPLYADAVNFRILQETLSNQTERNNRPPFAYLYNYIGAWYEPTTYEAIQPVTRYLAEEGGQALGLPPELFVWHIETNDFRLVDEGGEQIDLMRFASTSGLANEIELVGGRLPEMGGDFLEVLVTEGAADALGIGLNQRFMMREPDLGGRKYGVEVVGVWRPLEPEADYWFYTPESFDEILVVSEGAYAGILEEVYLGVWYWVLDGSRVGTGDVEKLVSGAREVEREIASLLPETQALQSPVEALGEYERAVSVLTGQLVGFNAPTLGLVVAFIGLVVGLVVQQRGNEMAITRSRGGTAGQLVGMAVVEGVILGVLAFLIGCVLALILTGQLGRVRSFMDFSADLTLRTQPNRLFFVTGITALILGIISQIIPTIFSSRDTIIDYKQKQARRSRPPWWQRSFLDVILFGLALFGFYHLQSGQFLGSSRGSSVLENPLLLVLPTIGILSVTLFFLRILPLVMGILSRFLALTNSVTLLQASRYLARSTGLYATPLVILTLTVSLSVFTASLARTFDYQLFDQWFYRTGADVNLLTTPTTSAENRFNPRPVDISTEFYTPPEAYELIDGVHAATRIGRFPANVALENNALENERVSVEFVGIEPQKFREVAYWRWDFSKYRMGSLMNAVTRSAESIIAPENFLEEHDLAVGDFIPLAVSVSGGRVVMNAEISASFDYFPTYYPDSDDVILVGNIDTIFQQIGGETQYRIWLDTDSDFDLDTLQRDLLTATPSLTIWNEPRDSIESTLILPQRQGVFGLLSVGFIASALLTVIGFFLYAIFSFRRRMIELGVLRAIGLSTRRMMGFIAWELGLLIFSGLTLGTLLGVWISQQFIPLLQTGRREVDLVPPYLVEIAWPAIIQIYILFILLFLVAFAVLSLSLQRMKLFETIKLGETV